MTFPLLESAVGSIQTALPTTTWPQLDVLKALPGAVYATDAEGRITFYNEAAANLWGLRPTIGQNEWCGSWRLYWPDGRPMPHDECPMAMALKQGRPISGAEAVAERPDGTRVWFLAYPTPLRDELGTLLGAVNMLVDITERRNAEHLAARLAAIVESSDDAIISKDLDGTITTWNSGAERLFGYAAEEIIRKPITVLIPLDRHNEEPEIIDRIRRGERVDHYETVRRRKDGSLVDISLTVSPIRDVNGRIVGASKIARDITERKRAQVQQDLLLSEMSHRVKNLFAVASSLVALSARSARTPAEMAEALQARMAALARAHGLTRAGLIDSADSQGDANLHTLVRAIFEPYFDARDSDRLVIDGCDFSVRAAAITGLALVLHEFATNAVKHGALSSSSGRIRIGCSVDDGALLLQWEEHGGPPLNDAPKHEGFGSRLAQQTVRGQFGGHLSQEWNAEGLVVRLSLPVDRLVVEQSTDCPTSDLVRDTNATWMAPPQAQ
jgi:PAS domain S-box-containing protein